MTYFLLRRVQGLPQWRLRKSRTFPQNIVMNRAIYLKYRFGHQPMNDNHKILSESEYLALRKICKGNEWILGRSPLDITGIYY